MLHLLKQETLILRGPERTKSGTVLLRDGQVILLKVKPHKKAGNVSAILMERLDIPTVTVQRRLKHLEARKLRMVNPVHGGDLSEQQLEQLLAENRLQREQSLLEAGHSETNTVNASCGHAGAVGLLLRIEMSIEGVRR